LLLPLSPADIEPPELPGLGADPEFELPRASGLWPKRWDPLFEVLFDLMFELLFPGLATSRPFPVDLPFDAFVALRAEKKC